jgi:methyl-accepting chemotaxis protein WspA
MLRNISISIRAKLALGFGLIVAIVLVLQVLGYRNVERLAQANEWDRHTLEVLLETEKIATSVLQIQSSTRGFMLTGNETVVGPMAQEENLGRKHLARALALTTDDPAQQTRLLRLAPLFDDWMRGVIWPLIDKRRALNKTVGVSQQVATSADVLNGAKTVAAIRALIGEVGTREQSLLQQRRRDALEVRQASDRQLFGGGAAAVVLAGLVAALLARVILRPIDSLYSAVTDIAAGHAGARAAVLSHDEMGRVASEFNRMAQAVEDSYHTLEESAQQLQGKVNALLDVVSQAATGDLTGKIAVVGQDAIGRMGEGLQAMLANLRRLIEDVQRAGIQVASTSTEIAASVRQHEATAIGHAETSVDILATTQEISANSRELLKTMENATVIAEYTTSATADAQVNLKRMDASMNGMLAATDSLTAKLAALSEKAANINGVLTTIKKVADQTNILSLNAAIEAEKAGEAGRGFSVVASEIRRLADQTSVSTADIAQMLNEMQSAVAASVMGMDKFCQEIRFSVGDARQVAGQLSGVMDQVQTLAPQFDLVLRGMRSQAQGANQISDTMRQFSNANQQTAHALKSTMDAVRQLQAAAGMLQSSVSTFAVHA